MALSPKDELELLQLEQEEHEHQQAKVVSKPIPQEAAPSEDQGFPVEQGDNPSSTALDAGITGALQGVTFGFSDKIGGAADVAGDVLKGNIPNSLYDKYRQYQQIRHAANEKQAQEHPYAYTMGEVGGGVAGALALPIPGASAIGLGGAARAAEVLGETGANLGSRLAGKAAGGVIEGIVPGALYGAGSSEKTIDQPLELAKDTAKGAATGSLVGAGMNIGKEFVGLGLKAASNMADNSAWLSKLRESYKLGKEGVSYGNRGQAEELKKLPINETKTFVDQLNDAKNELGKKANAALQKAQDEGIEVNINPTIQETAAKISSHIEQNPELIQSLDAPSMALLKKLASQTEGSFTPLEAKALGDKVSGMIGNLDNSTASNVTRGLATDFRTSLGNTLKDEIPEYAKAANNYKTLMENVHETILNQGKPKEYRDVRYGDLSSGKSKLFDDSQRMLTFGEKAGNTHTDQAATFKTLKDNLTNLQDANPEVLNAITKGQPLPEFLNNLQNKMSRIQASLEVRGVDPTTGTGKFALGSISGIPIAPASSSHAMANLAGLTSRLKSNAGTKILGDKLESAISNNDNFGKITVMYQLMQNPAYQHLVKEHNDQNSEEQ